MAVDERVSEDVLKKFAEEAPGVDTIAYFVFRKQLRLQETPDFYHGLVVGLATALHMIVDYEIVPMAERLNSIMQLLTIVAKERRKK